MRAWLFIPLVLAATPVAAQERSRDSDMARGAERAAEMLENPRNADAIGDAAGALTEAMLRLPVGGIVEAMRRVNPRAAENLPPVDRDTTIAEVAGSDPALPSRIAEGTRAGTAVAGVAIREMARLAPVLAAMGRDIAAQMVRRLENVSPDRAE